ncbi:hypothetical protein D1AOALGA4SA_4241 [Olavius algarvensis Delta 1 endosymbiont]|nr:hypothetical protein D1AOALGA4SA_4241 [Olavius algarvensis Delta 1 endosymbiont]
MQSSAWVIEPKIRYRSLRWYHLPLVFLITFAWLTCFGHAAELMVSSAISPPPESSDKIRPDQLPHSRATYGQHNIKVAWLAGPTDRYRHGVLGDDFEAARLVVETRSGKRLQLDLPPRRVFEDLEPRLVDLDGDGHDEIIVVESDTSKGASLAVYGVIDSQLRRIAATPFLGRPYRWLNPLGVGDFDGDGNLDIALVATPHIGGNLRLYRFNKPTLSLFAEYPGISTHQMGSTELGLGRVVSAFPRDQLLVPDQARRVLMLLEWSSNQWLMVARAALPGQLGSSLTPTGAGGWHFQLEDSRHFVVQVNR